MKIVNGITQNKKVIIITCLIIFIFFCMGFFGGIYFQRSLLKASAIGHWMKCLDLKKQNDHDRAILYCGQAIALNKYDPLFYHSLADIYKIQGATDLAIEIYVKAYELYKDQGKRIPLSLVQEEIRKLEALDANNGNKGENLKGDRGVNSK